MLFNSMGFLLFFPVVTLIYLILPRKVRYLWLLAASYYFYMCWKAKGALLIFFSTAVTYAGGLLMGYVDGRDWTADRRQKRKKQVVAGCFILNLGVLFYFKYTGFFLDSLRTLLGAFHIPAEIPVVQVVLPVGISFYTFQALSYTMDVYRGEIYAEKNFFRYALFVSFFPQLVAGPIERSKNLLKQLAHPAPFAFGQARDGFLLMLWGFFLKVVLADRIALFVDYVYGDYMGHGGWYLIVATVLFAFQIYCDFYGYSVIAMGAAKILGIRLMENFSAPYLARSVGEFWRRWHISLTSWFKDYLYIPLGGSRKGTARKYGNKLIVFLVSGLWHGAEASFVVWGGINGLYQIIGEAVKPFRDKAVALLGLRRDTLGHKLAQAIGTFLLVDFSWIFFRAGSLKEGLAILRQMVTVKNPWILFDGSLYTCRLDERNFRLMLLCLGVLLFADICKYKGIQIRQVIAAQDLWARCLFIVFAVCFILTTGIWGPGYDAANFIYFQF
ncbi:MAG: MBOAT family protein [Lachnospiraceae bacterium]|nr:MBOAT family protein [Lachnospiraceae bacterium]